MYSVKDLKVGSKITSHGMEMIVTRLTDTRAYGYNSKRFEKTGKKEDMSLHLGMFDNPHYKDTLKITND